MKKKTNRTECNRGRPHDENNANFDMGPHENFAGKPCRVNDSNPKENNYAKTRVERAGGTVICDGGDERGEHVAPREGIWDNRERSQ